MHDQRISRGDEPRKPSLRLAENHMLAQRVVLTQVLALHPDHLTIPELVREILAGDEEFAETDAIENAIRDLVGAGLLNCRVGLVLPTRAALHFNRIELD
jgi:hypothetical protein